jgi:hypothetical protein
MNGYFFGIAWNWDLDADFIYGIESECLRCGLTSYRVQHHNLEETMHRLREGELTFSVFLDRASDGEEAFEPLARQLAKSGIRVLNRFDRVLHSRDKATMHLELISAGVQLPYSIIIAPFNKKKEIELSLSELAHLGRPFIIKPANTTGGGVGVVLGAESLKDVIETRQHQRNDKYLLQEKVRPVFLGFTKAWFRVFYVCGEVIACWWDDETHVYRAVTAGEEELYGLGPMREIMKKIAAVSELDFFSSEITLNASGQFVVIDYVNEVCDMRLQSSHPDGVPDEVVHRIQQLLVQEAKRQKPAVDSVGPS